MLLLVFDVPAVLSKGQSWKHSARFAIADKDKNIFTMNRLKQVRP
jgi:hypothetical protein